MIKIAAKLRPFSFVPGTFCLIPGSFHAVEVFPTLLRIYDLREKEKKLIKEVPLETKGSPSHFMVIQDLEKGVVTIRIGRERFHILPSLELIKKRSAPSHIVFLERLSLGSHKKQEWEKISARKDFKEIFPLWMRLVSLLPPLPPRKEEGGMFSLLHACEKAIEASYPEHILPFFKKLYLAGFHDLLVPRLKDDEYQGILEEETIPDVSPLYLIKEGGDLIRSLFVKMSGDEIVILPHLPPEFHCGRLLHVATSLGELHLEWSKKTILQVIFKAKQDGILCLRFCSSLKSARLKTSDQTKVIDLGVPLEIKSGSLYLWDRFQK